MNSNFCPTDRTVLTIAGFDPSSGAGITADLAVFATHGFFGISAITALTVQSTTGVRRFQCVNSELLNETLFCLMEDTPPLGVKIGMLGGVEQVDVVAQFVQCLRKHVSRAIVVLDPVIRSSSGAELLSPDGLLRLQRDLLPVVNAITPNTEELALLTGLPCTSDSSIETACRSLAEHYPELSILATGGHRETPVDILFSDGAITQFPGEWIETRATHGTGCALSSAFLCNLLLGMTMTVAAGAAKQYVAQAMRRAVPRGKGNGPLHLLWPVVGHASS